MNLPPPPPLPLPVPGSVYQITEQGRAEVQRINVRGKGQRAERQVVKLLQAVVDVVRQRHSLQPIVLQRNALQAHLGGEDIHGLDGFSIEVKHQEIGFNNLWWKQCLRQCKDGEVPVLFYKQNNVKWRVMFRAFVNTPRDRDQIELDVTVDIDDFIEWFGNAYDESVS